MSGNSSVKPAEKAKNNMSIDEMKARIKLLSEEIECNSEENRFMEDEISSLQDKIDKTEG